MLAYWLAHSYSNLLGHRLRSGEQLTLRTLAQALAHDWAIVRGAGLPLVPLLALWAFGTSQETAVEVALWTAVACLLGFEILAGVRGHAKAPELALQAGVGLTIGLAITALRVILH